ncbi:scavenger receptor cysteine-rich domain superfamily protein-like [Antedon mediterranea]|uniref:scavenger receptor cysteine-rich domain superfamily protein-like n=1 Tax=Antedon mediterranea TaxID=105859 RepID=UPI003AF650A5
MVCLKRNSETNSWTLYWIFKQIFMMFLVVTLMIFRTVNTQLVQSTLPPPVNGDIRLSDGMNSLEGRVEVFYDGLWGTICDDDWGIQDADVVCRQLGYNMAARLGCCLSFGPGTGPIHMDNVECSGDENSIKKCLFNDWGRHNCGHWEDAGVVCANPIRLSDGSTALDGRVEVFMNGHWGTICNRNWDINDSYVVCRMLGGYSANEHIQRVKPGKGTVQLDNVNCTGTEASIEQCEKASGSSVDVRCRDHSRDVGVNCTKYIRLVNGSHPLEGRLEVLYNNQWGTVCDDQFSASDAEVVCRHLGNYITSSLNAYSCCALFGKGVGPILLSGLTCTGQERRVEDCIFQGNDPVCQHNRDVSIHCSDIRLVEDQDSLQGKLEFIENLQWGEICADDWDINDANVACRQLFNTSALSVYVRDTRSSRQPLFGGFNCNGTESRLSDCPRSSYVRCTGQHLAGIKCDAVIKIRLQDGPNELEGRVEVFYNNEWGTVCDDGWSIQEAAVVCRQLGNYDVTSAKCCNEYPGGNGSIHLDDMDCQGNERRLEECSHKSWGDNNCGHHEDAGVICSDLRIHSPTNQASSNIGPVKLLVNGRWGNICAEDWTLEAANVTCRQVHNTDVLALRFYTSSEVPRISSLTCTGDENLISDCNQGIWNDTSCPSGHIGGVVCQAANTVRLVDGGSSREGRVEVKHNGDWGTICDDNFGLPEANVICRQLGFIEADSSNCCQKFGEGVGQIFLDDLSCVGTEEYIDECGHRGWLTHNCGHHEDAGVICIDSNNAEPSGEPPDTQPSIRLVGGLSRLSGRVEILKDGAYGTVCDDGFGIEEATVVCRQLGFPMADPSVCCQSFGAGRGTILLDGLQCNGNEESLFQCEHLLRHNCEHFEDAGVNCLSLPKPTPDLPTDGQIRLSDGDDFQGRVEIFLGGQWGTVCDDYFDSKDADVICRQLGYKSAHPKRCCPWFGAGSGDILLDDLQCEGTETNILNCPHTNHNGGNCGHFEDVGVRCIRSVRLNSTISEFEGRLELQHNAEWVAICSEDFTEQEGVIACLHAGGLDFASFDVTPSTNTNVHAVNLTCSEAANVLDDCNMVFQNVSCQEVYLTCNKRNNLPLRLVGGKHPLEGRVEIFYKGQWGTVCDDEWGKAEAVVGCRQLGNFIPVRFQNPAVCCGAFGAGTLPILMDNVACTGAEPSLDQCSHRGWNVNNCDHFEDAGLICTDTRLVDGESLLEGRLQVLKDSAWLSVASYNWTLRNSEVVCRQLFNTSFSHTTEYDLDEDASKIISNVNCAGEEMMLSNCQSQMETYTEGVKVVGVACSDMRLVGGNRANEGRIEVISASGDWNSICAYGFSQMAANVACRQAGFCYASHVFHDKFGPAPVNVGLSELQCTGNESKLQNCSYTHGPTQCTNSYFVAGVQCKDTCDFPGRLLNGKVIPVLQSYSNGSSVTLECNEGYTLSGPSNITCENCAWKSALPVCKKSVVNCTDPPNILNATVNVNSGIAYYKCLDGYYSNEIATYKTCDSGKWSGPGIKCQVQCPDPPRIENAEVHVNSSVAHYKCLDGYHSNDIATYMTCDSENWSGPGITCEKDVENNKSDFSDSKTAPVVGNDSHSIMWLMASLLLLILILLVIYDIRKRANRLHCKPVRFNCAGRKDNEGELQLLSHDVTSQQHESALQEQDTNDNSWPA